MAKIALLEESVINKIAAGEVVERPSAVVKELIENAIDAGANAVTVELKDGGFSLIRITDNGCGLEREDVRNAFLRHATSKLSRIEDLQTIESLGFRGEALASIAAVSQTELVTKTAGALMGVRYVIEGGKEQSLEDIGCPEGTTFLVRNLFYNTPARKKFMKTPQTEAGYTGDMIQYLALSHPQVSFKFISNGQIKLQTSGSGSRKEAIYHIFGRDIASNLCEVKKTEMAGEEAIRLTGFCGKPVISRGNRNLEMYFINGRYIKNAVMNQAIEDAYKPYMMSRKYPFTALYLELPQHFVDVNVHPSKMEAQFGNREMIYQLMEEAISGALKEKELIPEVSAGKDPKKEKQEKAKQGRPPEPFEKKRISEEKAQTGKQMKIMDEVFSTEKREKQGQGFQTEKGFREKAAEKETVQILKEPEAVYRTEPKQTELFSMPLLSEEAKKKHRIIGQVFSTYWLVELEDKLFIIDQHAAHEKVLYERNLKAFQEKKSLYSQMIAPPLVVSLSMTEQEGLRENLPILKQMGFEIDPFGGNEYAVHAVPADMVTIADQEMFLEFLEGLMKGQKTPEFVLEKLAGISCKAAVKGGNSMSRQEVETLIDELLTLDNPYHCPHGRPTIISMSKYEMEKKFKRIV